jgi:[calcium/calmodulin-dependent protein kinase] kinase
LQIVLLYEAIAVRSADALFLVLEYMPGGVLMDVHLGTQPEQPPFPMEQAREYFRQLCLGLEYLHANEVLHRDVSALRLHDVIAC